MDYKKSLNLPQTDFPMKANLAAEPEMLKIWEETGIYNRMKKMKGTKPFILHDGPPMPTAIFTWARHSIKF